jgi:hypothetical protein
MDKSLDSWDLLKLSKEDSNHLNRSIMSNENEAEIKRLPARKSSRTDGLTEKFY